jgi:hypothetical protein
LTLDHFFQPVDNKRVISQGHPTKEVRAHFRAEYYSFVNIRLLAVPVAEAFSANWEPGWSGNMRLLCAKEKKLSARFPVIILSTREW